MSRTSQGKKEGSWWTCFQDHLIPILCSCFCHEWKCCGRWWKGVKSPGAQQLKGGKDSGGLGRWGGGLDVGEQCMWKSQQLLVQNRGHSAVTEGVCQERPGIQILTWIDLIFKCDTRFKIVFNIRQAGCLQTDSAHSSQVFGFCRAKCDDSKESNFISLKQDFLDFFSAAASNPWAWLLPL